MNRVTDPFRLTSGPLAYSGATPSRDGKQVFAIGTKGRGELIHYDTNAHQLLPFLSGISAIGPTFSKDGQWVAYSSYPDYTLWRSRSDGTERKQLTYARMETFSPSISPDGTKIVFPTNHLEVDVISTDGGTPQKIVDKFSWNGNWSPDGNLVLVYSSVGPYAVKNGSWKIFDVRSGKLKVVPSSESMVGACWVTQDLLVAVNENFSKFQTFDLRTQTWSDLLAGNFATWTVSPDGKYLYFVTAGVEPKAQRLRIGDRQIETIARLKDLRLVNDLGTGSIRINVAPDGSPVFTRNIGTQEIYALNVKWP